MAYSPETNPPFGPNKWEAFYAHRGFWKPHGPERPKTPTWLVLKTNVSPKLLLSRMMLACRQSRTVNTVAVFYLAGSQNCLGHGEYK